jgi:hypothetical protein
MTYKFSIECGPDATDNFNDYTRIHNTYNDYRYHVIIGSGAITSCEAMNSYPSYNDKYDSIDVKITEFADSCFNKASVSVVSVPSQLKKIGNHCFEKSNITTLKLPDTLEEIGHNNFPATLNSITIPPLIEHFPVDNLLLCDRITEIGLHKDNKSYRVIDGILYNYDVTEILYCPNAKKGKIIIPDSVKKIGDYCFYNNKQLTSVNIPTSVESIGKYAFCGAVIDNLVIPNSVVSIGIGCFQSSKIHKNFKFSHNVSIIPDKCFCQATIPTIIDLAKVQKIGSNAFDARTVKEPLPKVVSLQYTEYIGKEAFYQEKKTNFFELFSCIKAVDESAFIETADNLIVKFFSYVPLKVNINAFKGMGNNTTLMIPKGTKQIFENTIPWSIFDNIVEMELGYNIVRENVELISNDEHIYRLQSILDSIKKVNREYLRDIIQNLSYNYENITTDEEYDQALALIAYNNRFIPAIIPNLEVSMCKAWNTKYKLKILNKAVLEYANVPALENFMNTNTVRQVEKTNFQLLSNEVINNNLLSSLNPITVESYFDDILTILQNELCQVRSNIKIAVSWFTNYALFKTVNQLAENGVEVQIVINNDSINNGGYCLDFNELISKNNVKFNLVEYPHLLHHKFCIIDDTTVINGSYNWTRFSGSNYENIMIIRNDKSVVDSFNKEFERIIGMAEHQDIDRMPDSVLVRPEYDRSAFKQYITEELDSEAREISDERYKITLLHKASCLNPEYFEKINPSAKKDFADAFRVLEEQSTTTKDVIEMIDSSAAVSVNQGQNKIDETKDGESEKLEVNNKKTGNADIVQGTNYPSDIISVNCQLKEKIESIKASSLFLVLDVSGSMDNLYKAGHVHNIAEKVLSVSLTISESKEISLWKFGDRADFVENIGLENIQSVKKVHCEGTGTELNAFVDAASSSINDGSLVIIFTDDDLGSIKKAVLNIKNKSKVFWQIIVYGEHKNISSEISDCSNASLICMDDYASKSNSEINQILLKDYISWKNK